jgi:Asp/Glu/hydantoin racemase
MKIKVIRPSSKQNTPEDFMKYSADLTKTYASPGTEVDTVFISGGVHAGPNAGHINEARIMSSAQHVVREVIQAERDGYDAVSLTGEYDVGAEISRHMVNIPVIDAGPFCARFAMNLGDRICMLTIEDSLKSYARKLLRRWGLADQIQLMKVWNIPVAQAWPRRQEIKELTFKICQEAIDQDGANVILPACAVFMPFIVPPKELEDRFGVPVVNTVAVGLKMAELFVNLGIKKNEKVYPQTPTSVWGVD